MDPQHAKVELHFLELQTQDSGRNYWGCKGVAMWVIPPNQDECMSSLYQLELFTFNQNVT